ncbi:hypothetical protein [Treponema endosymbiont of Eucomonympha sp.]|nr:hypothetical protein [Treponema endosymbiont of Eucomonympha sp.]
MVVIRQRDTAVFARGIHRTAARNADNKYALLPAAKAAVKEY